MSGARCALCSLEDVGEQHGAGHGPDAAGVGAEVAGDLDAGTARSRLTWIGKQPMRLLGDAVLRRRAWELADELGWPSTYDAEYVALTILQADALITLDAELERAVRGIVETAPFEAIL